MTIQVTHATPATLPDEPGAEINAAEWNAAHTVTGAVPDTRTVNGHALSSDVTVTASDVGAVPTSRTVNGHALSSNVTVTASDVGAPSGSGTSSGTNTGDQDLSGLLVKASNLSDLTNAGTARTNLGLGTLATQSGTFSGTSSGTNTGDQTISDATISTSDITTNNASTSKHGFLKKLDNDASHFMDGQGNWSTPAGGGTVTTTGSPASGNLAKFSGATSVTNGDLTGAVTTSGGLVTSLASLTASNFQLTSQIFQSFAIVINNNAGTLRHAIYGSAITASDSAYASQVTGATSTYNNTPSVDASHDFVAGVGIVPAAGTIVLNTAAQDTSIYACQIMVEYYDGNVINPRVYSGFASRNVNGTTRVRPEMTIINSLSGAAFAINTTNIPSGKFLIVKFMGFLA